MLKLVTQGGSDHILCIFLAFLIVTPATLNLLRISRISSSPSVISQNKTSPFSIQTLPSHTAPTPDHLTAQRTMSSSHQSLAQFLAANKARYISDINENKGTGWTVVMGNEAGDLDSIASSIGYSWIETENHKRPTIALIQTKRMDLNLRPENLYALSLAGLKTGYEEVLCIDDLPKQKPFPSNTFVLVDHNRIAPAFTADNPAAHVVGVIDHHEDEGLYQDVSPRIISPSGSCTSLVVNSNRDHQLPTELATLLLTAIFIDTGGLKVGGKATREDRAAAVFLIPQSTLANSIDPTVLAPLAENPALESTILQEIPSIRDLSVELSAKKENLTHLGTLDLLRRDYKEYTFTLSSGVAIRAGLSTVLRNLGSCDDLWNWSRKWMAHRGLTIHGTLTSFRDESKINRLGKPKHRREMAWVVGESTERLKLDGLPDDEDSDGWVVPKGLDVDDLASRLWAGLESSEVLQLKEHKKFKADEGDGRTRVYEQGNTNATRKETAPLLKSVLEALPTVDESKSS